MQLGEIWRRGGLYCSFFCNSLVFCHFIRKTRIFCRLRPRLSSRIRLSSALQSLLWTSKVPKKSNISNKFGFPFWVASIVAASSAARVQQISWRSGQNCKPEHSASAFDGGVACHTRTINHGVIEYPNHRLACKEGGHRFDPDHVHQRYSQTRIMTAGALANANAFEFLGMTGMHWALLNCQDLQPISVRIFARTSASSAADIFPLCLACGGRRRETSPHHSSSGRRCPRMSSGRE
jgi:hypothetical protein